MCVCGVCGVMCVCGRRRQSAIKSSGSGEKRTCVDGHAWQTDTHDGREESSGVERRKAILDGNER